MELFWLLLKAVIFVDSNGDDASYRFGSGLVGCVLVLGLLWLSWGRGNDGLGKHHVLQETHLKVV